MFGLGNSPFLDEDVEAFHTQCWSWLLRCTGGLEAFETVNLVLPTPEFFPKTDAKGHALAHEVLDHVQELAGMKDWPVELVAQAELAGRVSESHFVQNTGTAAGTFSHTGNSGRITYDPAQLEQPVSLVATFAHELGHYLNGGFPEAPPGGWDLVEPATDITAGFMGFGIFGANSAFHFTRASDSWATSRLGYITEREWAFNIAIFCALKEIGVEETKPHLKRHIYKDAQRASKYLAKHAVIRDIVADI